MEFFLSVLDELMEYMGGFVSSHKRQLFEKIVPDRTHYLQVVLSEVDDPLDANAAFRSCECFGIQNVHWIQGDSGSKMSRGVSVGATKWLDLEIYQAEAFADCQTKLRHAGLQQFALSTRPGSVPVDLLPLDRPLALWFASETGGFRSAVEAQMDGFVHLPMMGFGRHFNFSVAVALTLQKVKSRLEREGHCWQMNPEERVNLLLGLYATVPKSRRQIVSRFLEMKGLHWQDLVPEVRSSKFWQLVGSAEGSQVVLGSALG